MSRRRVVLVSVAVLSLLIGAAAMFAASRSDDGRLISRPWTRSEVSEDGRQLTLWVEKPGDPGCEVFDHIDVSRRNDGTVTATAWYRRTNQEFCQVPCPLIDEPQSVSLDAPLTNAAIEHGPSVQSCR